MADYKSHGSKMKYAHGNKKIGTDTPATKMPDGSDAKPKTSGGKSAKSATSFRTY